MEKRKLKNDLDLHRISRESYDIELAELDKKRNKFSELTAALSSGKIDGKTYNAEVFALMESKRSKSEAYEREVSQEIEKTRSLSVLKSGIIVITLAFIVFLVAYFILHIRFIDDYTAILPVDASEFSEPVKTDLSATFMKQIYGKKYIFSILATYQLTGTVNSLETHANIASSSDIISPLETKISWKSDCSPLGNLIPTTKHCESKNHLIPAGNSIYDKLSRLQVGDTVILSGFLVDVSDSEGNPIFISSTTLEDDFVDYISGHSPISGSSTEQASDEAEVFYVTSITWLK